MTGIEAFKYQASDGYESVLHTLFVRDYAQSLVHSAKVNRGPHRREITATFKQSVNDARLSGSSMFTVRLEPSTPR